MGTLLDGVRASQTFVLILSEGVFKQAYVQMEVTEALLLEKKVILVHKAEEMQGSFNFEVELRGAPEHIVKLAQGTESLPWRSRDYERIPIVEQILTRASMPAVP